MAVLRECNHCGNSQYVGKWYDKCERCGRKNFMIMDGPGGSRETARLLRDAVKRRRNR